MKEHKAIPFIDSLQSGLRTFPVSLHVALTDFCPAHCNMCGHWRRSNKQVLDYFHWAHFLRCAPVNQLQSVCYTGGDPVMYPRLKEVLDIHNGRGIAYAFATTGIDPLQHMTTAQARKAAWFRISFDSCNPKEFEALRGCSWEEVVTGIHTLYDLGCTLQFHITHTDPDAIQVTTEFIQTVWPVYKKITSSTINSLKPHHQAPTKCWASRLQHFIDTNGDVYPCCMVAGDTEVMDHLEPLCSIEDYSWSAIHEWESQLSSLPPVCQICHPRFREVNEIFKDHPACKRFF